VENAKYEEKIAWNAEFDAAILGLGSVEMPEANSLNGQKSPIFYH